MMTQATAQLPGLFCIGDLSSEAILKQSKDTPKTILVTQASLSLS